MRRWKRGAAAVAVLAAGLTVSACGSDDSGSGAPPASSSSAAPISLPPAGARADYQLGGGYAPESGVRIVVRDSTDKPATGLYNVCYLNAFQTQPGTAAFWNARQDLVLRQDGKPVANPDWPDEWLLDISTAAKRQRLVRIVGGWIAGCAKAGYQAVEFDNLDSFSRSHGAISTDDADAFARAIVSLAHDAGLAAGQKNRADFDGRTVGFDFAIAESCAEWDECGSYLAHFGDHVIDVEYRRSDFATACRQIGSRASVVYADLELTPHGPREWC
ncbi:endo alpha-1,4 polygalactosaminidase [Nocardioides sp.]|uniref:endo alpha-1,4 polygalactosaminidase n=1 Tax=Nocardioides sp. TaxID=35761 RepID=UPI00261AEAFC|nr:endo alpha-1,4 polygalactosaminidase [Nocardioides sp.]